ncbi:DUF59 domain-containing protein [Candidatus Sumerlaeota bacterium]|nr:DUF59 domain-containing protein [Candidatus Sumerlaeota bacterium]
MLAEFKSNRLEKILKEIEHPEIAYTLFDLGMMNDINISEDKVSLTLKVPMLGIPIRELLISEIESAVKKVEENIEVEIRLEEMNEEERTRFLKMAQQGWRF